MEGGHPTAFWPVGYPGFLASIFFVFEASPRIAAIAQLILSALSSLIVLSLARRLFGSDTTGRLSILILAIYPNQIEYVGILLPETLVTFLLLSMLWAFVTWPGPIGAAVAGCLAGALVLTKPQFILLVILLPVITISSRRSRTARFRSAALVVVTIIVVAPWTYRNWSTFHAFVPVSANDGINLLVGNNPSARGDYTPNDPLVASVGHPNVAEQIAVNRRARDAALMWIWENPIAASALLPRKVWRLWAPDGEAEWSYQAGFSEYEANAVLFRFVRGLNQAFYVAILAAYITSIPLYLQTRLFRDEPWTLFGHFVVLVTTMVSLIFFGHSRFHFPAMPWIIMYGAWWLAMRRVSVVSPPLTRSHPHVPD